jgi:succinate dehydrogenase / fumarate reductase iron-sulfur subunit
VTLSLTLKIWRQEGPDSPGRFEVYQAPEVNEDMSFLEMLDVVNEELAGEGKEPIAFDSDCREGICGMCGVVINGIPHGNGRHVTTCQLHMRNFNDGDTLVVEPWRSTAFPIIKDLVVNRGAFDKIIQSGGYISVTTGSAVEANTIPVPKPAADLAMDAAACIGCGACVAACPNGAAQLFTGAKVTHLASLPQGQSERAARVVAMVETMESYFGSCTNYRECEAVCPAGISINVIAQMNKDYIRAKFRDRRRLVRPVDLMHES